MRPSARCKPASSERPHESDDAAASPAGGYLPARHLGAARGGVRLYRHLPCGHHCALRPARDPACACDLRRRPRHGGGCAVPRLCRACRHLEGRFGRHRRCVGGGRGLARAAGLSGLFRAQGLSAALALRHHHRSDRSATLRGAGAAARARGQSNHLSRTLCRRPAAGRLSRRRSPRDQCDSAGRLRSWDFATTS